MYAWPKDLLPRAFRYPYIAIGQCKHHRRVPIRTNLFPFLVAHAGGTADLTLGRGCWGFKVCSAGTRLEGMRTD